MPAAVPGGISGLGPLIALQRQQVHMNIQPHLNIFAPSHFLEVLLLLEGLVHLVVRHAEAAQPSLNGVVHLGEHHKLGQVRHADQLPV